MTFMYICILYAHNEYYALRMDVICRMVYDVYSMYTCTHVGCLMLYVSLGLNCFIFKMICCSPVAFVIGFCSLLRSPIT